VVPHPLAPYNLKFIEIIKIPFLSQKKCGSIKKVSQLMMFGGNNAKYINMFWAQN
jgi:hypothetical protein